MRYRAVYEFIPTEEQVQQDYITIKEGDILRVEPHKSKDFEVRIVIEMQCFMILRVVIDRIFVIILCVHIGCFILLLRVIIV